MRSRRSSDPWVFDDEGEDSADIEQMLLWDVRPEPVFDDEDE